MNRKALRLFAVMGALMMWILLAPAAQAVVPPSPVVTTPATADFIVVEANQPIEFVGTVAGPVDPGFFDRLQISNFTANPGDPPLRCDFILTSTNWSCTSSAMETIGDHELRVRWIAFGNPDYGDASANTVLTLHVVAALPPDPPPPGPTTSPPAADPTPAAAPVVVPVPPVEPTTEPTTETEEPVAETPVAIVEPGVLIPGLPEAPADVEEVLEAWNPTDHPKKVLGIGVAAFTILTLLGPGGLALSSVAGAGMAGAAGAAAGAAAAAGGGGGARKSGSVKAAKVKMNKFSGAGAGVGDKSRTWQLPGWQRMDAWSMAVPIWLATRSPLTARILADGSYLRAIFSSAWGLLVIAGGYLGLVAAHQTNGVPIAPSLALTTALLVIAIFDATAGAAGVLGFLAGMFIWRSDQLSTATTIRSFLGLAALWFAIPLIAAATRPFRRTTVVGSKYAWDRLADCVIGTLTAGWAVEKTIGGMPGLSGLDLPIADHANRLALIAMVAVVARVLIEEFVAWRYPLRLSAVEKGKMPFAGSRQRIFATGLRTVLFVFLSIAFIGNCWQLWVGAVLFLVPQVLSIYERKFPNSERLHGLLPGGILKTLIMLIIGSFFARLVFSILTNPETMLRNGFLLMTIPGLVLSALGLFGHDGPDPEWTWRRQFIGVGVLGAILYLVFTGF